MADFFKTSNDMIPARSIGYLIRRIEQLTVSHAEHAFADAGLTFSQWVSLVLIRHALADTCSSLSRSLGHNSGATTRLIDQLEERALISRERDRGDRRVVMLALTPAGHDALAVLTPRMMRLWNALLEDFGAEEVEMLLALLTRLLAKLESTGRVRP